MKIYIASSWKNEAAVKTLAEALRLWGHEVDCFCDSSSGRYVFHWTEMPNCYSMDAITFLEDERAQKAFKEDKSWIDWADCVIMVLPCGNSAHLEAGYAKGQRKRLYILGDFLVGEFDVMYGFADGLFRSPTDLKIRLM